MTKPSTRAKKKYNQSTYDRYEFNLRKDSTLSAILLRYKSTQGANLSNLLKTLLCDHFGISMFYADEIYPEYFLRDGKRIPNTGVDKYFPSDVYTFRSACNDGGNPEEN